MVDIFLWAANLTPAHYGFSGRNTATLVARMNSRIVLPCFQANVNSPLFYASPFVSDAAAGLLPTRDLNALAGAMNAACAGTDATRCAALSQTYGRAARQAVCVMGYPGSVPMSASSVPPTVLAVSDVKAQRAAGHASVLAALSAVGSAPSGVTACVPS